MTRNFGIYFLLLLTMVITGCSKDEDPILLVEFDKAIIKSITLNALDNYENWDSPGRPDVYFELILEPSTFVTTSMIMNNVELPAVWDQEIQLPGEKTATYFLRFSDQDIGVIDDQLFAATLRPELAYPDTLLSFSAGGNEMEIRLRYE